MIDEAEQHLHINAQSDLVRTLQDLTKIQQVIYTTHSPGCLPADLGNGIRFVQPKEDCVSTIRHDFWSLSAGDHVGFNPLLMAMGAGATAFSGLRNSLLVEGASDILLLPTIIKLATGASELPYQVAPGISVASKNDMARMDLAASRVAFLVDGDGGGDDWREQLEAAGVNPSRVNQLPNNVAAEDLLDGTFFIESVNGILTVAGHKPIVGVPEGSGPIKAGLASWLSAHKVSIGPVAIAEHILGAHESGKRSIVLNPERVDSIASIDRWAPEIFGA